MGLYVHLGMGNTVLFSLDKQSSTDARKEDTSIVFIKNVNLENIRYLSNCIIQSM